MGLSYFWFIAAAVIGAMDLYFGNFFLLVISAAAFTTALFSFFLSSVYLQVAVFTVISLLVISYLMLLQRHLREVDFYSEILRRHIGKTVTVHEWRHNRYATVQYNGEFGKPRLLLMRAVIFVQGNTKYGKCFRTG